jgi:hypothetical protein
VDDILLFCNDQHWDVENLAEISSMFHRAIGITINVHKSTIYFYWMEEELEAFFKIVFPYKTLDFREGIKYLGFHLKPNDHWKSDWHWLLAKLENQLKGWSFRWLSRAGRLTLENRYMKPFHSIGCHFPGSQKAF